MSRVKDNELKIKCFYIFILFFTVQLVNSQTILFDDINCCHDLSFWTQLIDSLESNGAYIHYLSREGWSYIDSADMLWLMGPLRIYSDRIKELILNYLHKGGKIFIGDISCGNPAAINDLLKYPSWRTSLVIDESIAMPICIADIIAEIEPLTNDLNYLLLDYIRKIHCGENSFPFLFVDKNTIVAAVSYPFLDEGNCNFLILATGLHIWENVEHPYNGYNFKFAINIFHASIDSLAHKLNSCSSPVYPANFFSCKVVPNPITPNFDAINDFAQFEFDGIFVKPARIHIFDIHGHEIRTIDVPAGLFAKQYARWDGTDDGGNPVPEGVYIYTIEVAGEIVCEGTITVAR